MAALTEREPLGLYGKLHIRQKSFKPLSSHSPAISTWARCDKDKVEHLPRSFRQSVCNNCFSLCVCFYRGAARTLHEVSLQESIRYAPGDAVEKWLNDLLCLDCLNITRIVSGCPLPEACELYPPGALCPAKGRGRGENYTGSGPLFHGCCSREHSVSRFPSLTCFCSGHGVPLPR